MLPGQEEHQREQDADDPRAGVDFLDLAGEDLHEHIGDQTEGDTVGDVVGQGHERDRHEAGHGGGRIVPVDVADVGHHQNADVDQRRGAGVGRDELRHGGEEHCDEEHRGRGHRGKTRAAALGYTGGGLDERRDGGGAAGSADAGGAGIGQHGAVHVGDVAILVEQAACGAGAVERAEGVEHVDHAEGEHRRQQHDDKRADAVGVDIGGEIKAGLEHGEEGLRAEVAERAEEVARQVGGHGAGIEAGHRQQTHGVVHDGRTEDAPQHRAAHLLLAHGADGEHGQNRDEHGEDRRPRLRAGEHVEGVQRHAGGGAVHDDARVLQTDERDEQADTGGDGHLDGVGDGVEDEFAQAGDGQQDEDDAVKQHQHEGIGVAQTHADADGIDKVGVEAHAGGLREGEVRQKADEQRADHGGDRRCDIHRTVADAEDIRAVAEGIGKHTGVDHQNIGHRHERGDARHDLGLDGRTMFFYLKETFHL